MSRRCGWGFLPKNLQYGEKEWMRFLTQELALFTLAIQNLTIMLAVFISSVSLCILALSPVGRNNSPVSQRAIDRDKNSPLRQWVHLFLSHFSPQTAGSLYEGSMVSLRSHRLRSLNLPWLMTQVWRFCRLFECGLGGDGWVNRASSCSLAWIHGFQGAVPVLRKGAWFLFVCWPEKGQFSPLGPNPAHSGWLNQLCSWPPTLLPPSESHQDFRLGTSLMAQWIRIPLPVQGTQVWSLGWEDSTFHEVTKPESCSDWAACSRANAYKKRSHCSEEPKHCS